ncbi:MAG: acyl-CoA dehydrogenase family protein [Acidimicrobiia bacterium]
MDFRVVDDLAHYRDQAREWVDKNVNPDWVEEQKSTGTYHTQQLHKQLADEGYLGAGWPKEYGGSDVDPDLARTLFQEIYRTGMHMDGWATTEMVAHTVLHTGTEEQKKRFVGGALAGDIIIVLGYTEPDNGSDAAAAKCKAERDGDEWIINGTKMFTSTAHVGTHVFLLTRSNWDVPKHKGLTMFLTEMNKPGFDCQPVHTLGGQRTNATFYSDFRIPDADRIGDAEGGWGVMKVALVYERGGSLGASGPTLPERFAAWAQSSTMDDGSLVYDNPLVKEKLARIAIDVEIAKLLGSKVAWVSKTGGLPGVEGSMAKLFGPEAAQRHYSDLLDLLGPEAVLQPHAEGAPLDGSIEHAFRNAVVATVYGGSSEIMREIIAERRLGLPRARP